MGTKGIIAIIITVACLGLIGIGVVQGKIPWDVLFPSITTWIGAVISSIITATVMIKAFRKGLIK